MRGEKEARTFSLGSTPAVCGEKYRGSSRCGQLAGSPPRMRGKGGTLRIEHKGPGITPAYAGKSPLCSHGGFPPRDHPRVCGEKTVEQFREDYPQGSPPRMRGKAPCRLFQLVDFGITPAYAGKSPGPGSGRSAFRDHPRVCGEKEFSRLTSKPGLGSPPRMRGKGLAGREAGRQGGITPAYAGKSPPSDSCG